MATVIEIAKAAVTAYNEKDWDKTREIWAADAVYDEKATGRRFEGAGQIIEARRLGRGNADIRNFFCGVLRRRLLWADSARCCLARSPQAYCMTPSVRFGLTHIAIPRLRLAGRPRPSFALST